MGREMVRLIALICMNKSFYNIDYDIPKVSEKNFKHDFAESLSEAQAFRLKGPVKMMCSVNEHENALKI